jgi:type I site-specific restriction endonuclease
MPYSEDDTRVKIIDPQIHENGWKEEYILRNYPIADDRFYVEGEDYKRLPTAKFADYVLLFNNVPIAVLEAKAEDVEPIQRVALSALFSNFILLLSNRIIAVLLYHKKYNLSKKKARPFSDRAWKEHLLIQLILGYFLFITFSIAIPSVPFWLLRIL